MSVFWRFLRPELIRRVGHLSSGCSLSLFRLSLSSLSFVSRLSLFLNLSCLFFSFNFSKDALTKFGQHNKYENNMEVKNATTFLLASVIPQFRFFSFSYLFLFFFFSFSFFLILFFLLFLLIFSNRVNNGDLNIHLESLSDKSTQTTVFGDLIRVLFSPFFLSFFFSSPFLSLFSFFTGLTY